MGFDVLIIGSFVGIFVRVFVGFFVGDCGEIIVGLRDLVVGFFVRD